MKRLASVFAPVFDTDMNLVMRTRRQFTVDRAGAEMAALFVIVCAAAAWLSLAQLDPNNTVAPPQQFGSGTGGEVAAATTWALAEVVFAGLFLGFLALLRYVPEWVRELVKTNLFLLVFLVLGVSAGYASGTAAQANWAIAVLGLVFVGGNTLITVTEEFDVWWVVNNALVVAVAVVSGLMLGLVFGPVGLAFAAVVLTVYDHFLANKSKKMFTMGAAMVREKLPVVFIRPETWRFEWDDLADEFAEADSDADLNERSGRSWGIGMADMMLPAGIVSGVITSSGAVWTTFGGVAVAVLIAAVGVACFRLRTQMLTSGSGAGLPVLSTGVLVPYVALALVAWVV